MMRLSGPAMTAHIHDQKTNLPPLAALPPPVPFFAPPPPKNPLQRKLLRPRIAQLGSCETESAGDLAYCSDLQSDSNQVPANRSKGKPR